MHICKIFCTFAPNLRNMKKIGIVSVLLACLLCGACTALEKKQRVGAVVELNGNYIYRSTLDSLTVGMSSEDSLRVAQQYISQWAKDILLYEAAKSHATSEMEQMVEDYRRTLYAQAYEAYLVERRMPKTVSDTMVEQVYLQMPDRFQLDESILKGLLLVVPLDAPKLPQLKKMLAEVKEANGNLKEDKLDAIEKYAYQNASGYELFVNKWMTTTEMMAHIPIERAELETALKNKNQIEASDSLQIYILQVTEKHLLGAQMPIEYARPEIEKMILNARQVEFLQKERERLYNEAIQDKKVNFYNE